MRKTKHTLLFLLLTALTLSLGIFAAACAEKNEGGNKPAEGTYYTVSFDEAGGSYAAGKPDPIRVAAGAKLLDAVKDVTPPTKSGLTFGNWFYGDIELNSATSMPAEDITLVAKYKADYTIESYLQNTSRNSYLKQADIVESDYVGKTVSPEAPNHNGFVVSDSPTGIPEEQKPVSSLELTENAADNVFRFYFDRRLYTVHFDANAPEELVKGSMPELEVYYGLPVDLTENAFSYEKHRFVGWSTSPTGEAEYLDKSRFPEVSGNLQLFAVWDRGYVDRYGGGDIVFFPTLEPEKAILSRGGQEFEGTREGDTFSFTTGSGNELKGKVYSGYFYSYERTDLVNTYVFYANTPDPDCKDHLYDEDRTLTIKPYMTATYNNHGDTYEGTVSYADATGDYIFTGTNEQGKEENFRFLPANFTKDDNHPHEHVFSLGGDEADTYIDFIWLDRGEGSGFLGQTMGLLLDGYSTAMLIDLANGLYFDGRYYVTDTVAIGDSKFNLVTCILTDDIYGSLSGEAGAQLTQYLYTIPITGEYNGFVLADKHRNTYHGEQDSTVTIDGKVLSLKDATVTLDGFGIFDNSATCTIGDQTYSGMYDLSTDLLNGSVLTVYYDSDKSFRLQIDTEKLTVSAADTQTPHTEFRWMDGNALHPPFLFLYDEDYYENEDVKSGEPLGKKMEVWIPDGDESKLTLVASGYCTMEALGSNARVEFYLYTFHRTCVKEGYDTEIPTEMEFYNTSVTSTTDYQSYNVYCLLGEKKQKEEGGEEETLDYKKVISVTGGGKIWQCTTVSTTGLGSLYFIGDEVYEGQFTIEKSANFDREIGTFLYATPEGVAVTLRFEMSENDTVATPIDFEETLLYLIPPTGPASAGVGNNVLFIDGIGLARMATSTDGSTFTYESGTYQEVDMTPFNETIYAFYVGESERFRFVITDLPGADYEGVLFGIRFDNTIKKDTFTSGNATLTIDHYHTAALDRGNGVTVYGDYYLTDMSGGSIVFIDERGVEYKFFIHDEKGTFEETDWAVGYKWQLLDNNYEPIGNLMIEFDGNGTASVYKASEESNRKTGKYRPLGTYNATFGYEEYLLVGIDFFDEKNYPSGNYKVTFAFNANGVGACFVCNKNILDDYQKENAVFIDDDWNVLTLDGYHRGSIVTGAYSGSGSFTVIDFEKNFIALEIDDDGYSSISGKTFYYLLCDNGSFLSTNYEELANSGKAGLFADDRFETIVLGTDGIAYIGAKSGPYYVENDTAYVYLTSTPVEVKIGDNTITYENKTYRLCDSAQLTMNGVVYLLKEKKEEADDQTDKIEATLTFTPNLTTNSKRPTTFVLKGKGESGESDLTDDGFTLSLYAGGGSFDSTDSSFSPTVTYGNHVYPIAFSYKDNAYTFEVKAGYNSVEYLDHTARYYENEKGKDANGNETTINRGMRIYKTSFGFGPISEEETMLSGDFLYLYDESNETYKKPIHFDNVKESDVYKVGYVPSYGDRLEFVFTGSDQKNYALNYYEWYEGGIYFWCFGLYTYQDYETEDGNYTVRAKTLVYTKMPTVSGYGDEKALGTVTNVTLFDKKTGEATLIESAPETTPKCDPKTVLTEYDTGVVVDGYGKGVWLVGLDSVLEKGTTGTCAWGDGYLVTFTDSSQKTVSASEGNTITGAEVKKYQFVQVVNYSEYLVNLFVDDEGNVRIVGFAVYNGNFGRYDWLSNPHDYEEIKSETALTSEGNQTHFTLSGSWGGKEVSFDITVTKTDEQITVPNGDEEVQKDGYTVDVEMHDTAAKEN